jgi:hypothetical protein
LYVVPDKLDEVGDDVSASKLSSRLSKAFAALRGLVAKGTGLQYGQVKALGDIEDLVVKGQRRRVRQLEKALQAAVREEER